MSTPIWAKNTGRNNVSSQPVSCNDLKEALQFIKAKNGEVFGTPLLAHLQRTYYKQFGQNKANHSKDVVLSLSNFNFVSKEDKRGQVLKFRPWVSIVGGDLKSREDVMVTLATGILSGGATAQSLEREQIAGTRLILHGLRAIASRGRGPPSVDELANEIKEGQALAIQFICSMLDRPDEKDPFSLGIVDIGGKLERKETGTIIFRPEKLRSYQLAIVSRYLCEIIPQSISNAFGMDLQTALTKGLSHTNADSIRQAITHYPPVWIGFDEVDGLVEEVTARWGFTWWPEDASGGGEGLNGNQDKVYLRLDSVPQPIRLNIS